MNSYLHLSNKLKKCVKFFSYFIIDSDEECTAAILIALLKKHREKEREREKKRLTALWFNSLLPVGR